MNVDVHRRPDVTVLGEDITIVSVLCVASLRSHSSPNSHILFMQKLKQILDLVGIFLLLHLPY